jgi:hypothetical protein
MKIDIDKVTEAELVDLNNRIVERLRFLENSVMSSVQRAAIAWNILTAAGIAGIRDVFVPPITNGVNICVQIKKAYQGQP